MQPIREQLSAEGEAAIESYLHSISNEALAGLARQMQLLEDADRQRSADSPPSGRPVSRARVVPDHLMSEFVQSLRGTVLNRDRGSSALGRPYMAPPFDVDAALVIADYISAKYPGAQGWVILRELIFSVTAARGHQNTGRMKSGCMWIVTIPIIASISGVHSWCSAFL